MTGSQDILRFDFPQAGLRLVQVSAPSLSILVIAGSPAARQPFEATALTITVDDLDAARRELDALGATRMEPVRDCPTGRRTRYQHPDGLVVEYVEHQADKLRRS